MDSERTRNLKELRQKRLQYYDKIKPQSMSPNQKASIHKDDKISSKGLHKPSQKGSILAWESELSPQHSKRSTTLISTEFQSRLDGGLHSRSSSDRQDVNRDTYMSPLRNGDTYMSPLRNGDNYMSPLRRSLNQAQTFSTTSLHNSYGKPSRELNSYGKPSGELNGYGKPSGQLNSYGKPPGEFNYSFEDFKPVDKERFYSTKPVEDLMWTSPNSAGKYLAKEASETSHLSSKTSNLPSKTDNQTLDSSKETPHSCYDAFRANNILQEMGHARQLRAQVHNELKTNFEHHSSGWGQSPNSKYGSLATKSMENKSDSMIDVNHNTAEVDQMRDKVQSGVQTTSSEDQRSVEGLEASKETLNVRSSYQEEISVAGMEDFGEDEVFDLGALQEAAKQGDDVLRQYIKRLSQRLHSKTDKEDGDVDQLDSRLNQSLQKEIDDGKLCYQNSPETYKSTNGVEDQEQERDQEHDTAIGGIHGAHQDHASAVGGKEEDKEGAINTRTEMSTSNATMTKYEPKILQAAITSNQLEELGLFEDLFSSKQTRGNESPTEDDQKHLAHTQYDDDVKNLGGDGDKVELMTHRPGNRPISPLKSVHFGETGSFVKSSFPNGEFPYIHIPSPPEEAGSLPNGEPSNDVNMMSDGSDAVEETHKKYRPKPPGMKSVSRRNVKQQPSPSNPKRPKTPERHIAGVREHHQRDRETRKQSPSHKRRQSASPIPHERINERQSRSLVRPEGKEVSVVNSSFQRGISPEPKPIAVPSLNLHDIETSRLDGSKDDGMKDAQEPEWMEASGQVSSRHDDDNESMLMHKIADFKPQVPHHVGGSGDAPTADKTWFPQVSFELPHQDAINDLLGRSSDQDKRSLPAVRPSSAGPQRSATKSNKPRPSSAKSIVSQYMDGSTQYKRRWATSSSLWGSRSITTSPGELQVAGQRSKLTDAPKSPTVVRKTRPTSAKNVASDGEPDVGSRVRGQRARPWSASGRASRQKEQVLRVDPAQLQDSHVVKTLESYNNMSVPPLTMRLIVESPRGSEGLSVWQLLPDEILLHIFSYLSQYHLVQCAQTCSLFNRIALDESLWRHIHLEKRVLSDFWLTQIGERHPANLEIVQCSGNITENGLRNLFRSCADNLKELNVSGCSSGELSGDSLLLHASRCYQLTRLDASWCSVTDNGLTAINDSVRQLNSLCLNGCREISDQCLRAVIVKHGKSLTVLEVFGCFNLSIETLTLIGEECKRLKTLNIGQCYKLTDESIAKLAPHLKGLRHLDLRGCKQVRDGCIRKLVRHCKKLESLVLANCTHITNTSLTEIATYMPYIKHLDLAGCKRVTNEGVKALATNCHQLTTLDISSTSIDHKSVAALASYCGKSLRGLKLNCCKEITEASIVKLLKHCKQLQTVHLYGVKRLHTLSVLKLQYPCLMYESILK